MEALRAARAHAQLLHRPASGVVETVRHLLAVQAQDIPAYPLALRARSRTITPADVTTALEDRSVIRTWGPRGTLHLILAEDLPWLSPLLRPTPTAALRRLRQLGVETTPAEAAHAVDRALAGQGPLTKPELSARLKTIGLPAEGQAVLHLAALAAREGLLVLGPPRSGKPTYVHTADWLGAPLAPETDRPKALTELTRRYLRAHAPATPQDLATWSGLPLRDTRSAWPGDSAPQDPPPPPPRVSLLPAYDEYLLGWSDRGFAVPAPHLKQVHPGGGILRPTVLANAEAVATWHTKNAKVAITPFTDLPENTERALEAESADLTRFLVAGSA